ncbi:MAG: glycosyltransferase family A protein [Candidatus Saccharimonadales bacterium]
MISVITPNYNGDKWLGDYLDSITNQTLPQEEIEVMFVDDGSTDKSREIVESYSDRIPGLRPIWHEHTARPGELRNLAVQRAIGKYVLFLDSDDYIGTEALERLDGFSSENPSDIFAFQLEGIDRNVPRSMLNTTAVNVDLIDSGLYKTLGIWKMVDRKFIIDNDIRFDPSIRRGDDVMFFIEAMLKAKRLSVLSDYPFYMLRGREDGTSITQEEWDHNKRLSVVKKAAQLVTEMAQDKRTKDHFMIRLFNADAIEITESASLTDDTVMDLKQALAPHWNRGVADLIYTDSNRQKLINIFGEPIDE